MGDILTKLAIRLVTFLPTCGRDENNTSQMLTWLARSRGFGPVQSSLHDFEVVVEVACGIANTVDSWQTVLHMSQCSASRRWDCRSCRPPLPVSKSKYVQATTTAKIHQSLSSCPCLADLPLFALPPAYQVSSVKGLSLGLGDEFKLVHVERVPCMRPLTDRTFEYASAEATVWRRD